MSCHHLVRGAKPAHSNGARVGTALAFTLIRDSRLVVASVDPDGVGSCALVETVDVDLAGVGLGVLDEASELLLGVDPES